ncbi:hypothetical protein CHS0354_032941 [Potamilus streckersoni]|uniref:Uncharacterized protein n=1 Tax=Potamilus streckersoni TaxID=2493646 RepID=A0AAE0RWS2_9BIVA|nr:hypothetical protein CHS0354_032941 [Potamilus streckersoni]
MKENTKRDFYFLVRAYFDAIYTFLLEKLLDTLLRHIYVVDPMNHVTTRSLNLYYVLKKFPYLLPLDATVDTIKEQFCWYQSMDISMCLKNRIDEFWIAVSSKETDLQSLCNVMLSLLCFIAVLLVNAISM